ncbi:MAG: hypothetical protein CM15mP103_05680 [Gammaproteobacteria bacterium]|nr:MAG: hypothetical protein CM15mP103_05680 [Gammaproteobacteria bacterium]
MSTRWTLTRGAVVWHNKVGRGGFLGGVHWGMSANGDSLFVPIADTTITGRFTGRFLPGSMRSTPPRVRCVVYAQRG